MFLDSLYSISGGVFKGGTKISIGVINKLITSDLNTHKKCVMLNKLISGRKDYLATIPDKMFSIIKIWSDESIKKGSTSVQKNFYFNKIKKLINTEKSMVNYKKIKKYEIKDYTQIKGFSGVSSIEFESSRFDIEKLLKVADKKLTLKSKINQIPKTLLSNKKIMNRKGISKKIKYIKTLTKTFLPNQFEKEFNKLSRFENDLETVENFHFRFNKYQTIEENRAIFIKAGIKEKIIKTYDMRERLLKHINSIEKIKVMIILS